MRLVSLSQRWSTSRCFKASHSLPGANEPWHHAPALSHHTTSANSALDLLRRMKEDIRLASPDLLEAVRACFQSFQAPWTVESVLVSETGASASDPRVQLLSVRPIARHPQPRLTQAAGGSH